MLGQISRDMYAESGADKVMSGIGVTMGLESTLCICRFIPVLDFSCECWRHLRASRFHEYFSITIDIVHSPSRMDCLAISCNENLLLRFSHDCGL